MRRHRRWRRADAVLEGTIDPEGVASSYHFEYGTDVTYGKRVPAVDTDAGSGSVAVSARRRRWVAAEQDLLLPDRRLQCSGSIAGADRTLMTSGCAADAWSASPAFASAITPRSVRLAWHGQPQQQLYRSHGLSTARRRPMATRRLWQRFCLVVTIRRCSAFVGLGAWHAVSLPRRWPSTFCSTGPQYGADQTFFYRAGGWRRRAGRDHQARDADRDDQPAWVGDDLSLQLRSDRQLRCEHTRG